MKTCSILITLTQILGTYTLIVPDELPTILSVIYSNIPVIKKGTDSRLGWGFRLGDRADFQVLVELGPQTYTQPLGNQPDKSSSKRNTIDSLANTLYAQRQQEKKQNAVVENKAETAGGKWLETWSKTVNKPENADGFQKVPPGAKPGLAVGEIDAKSVIPDDVTLRLVELLKKRLQVIRQQTEEAEQGTPGPRMELSDVEEEESDESESATKK